MKCKPMILEADSVRALASGRKTQHLIAIENVPRADVVKIERSCSHPSEWSFQFKIETGIYTYSWTESYKAPYSAGDLVYIREKWARKKFAFSSRAVDSGTFLYAADATGYETPVIPPDFRSPTRMPIEAARYFIKITNVEPKQIQDPVNDCELEVGRWVWAVEFEKCEKPQGWPR